MALIKCKECGKEVSDKASTCPNCGNPITKISSNQQKKSNNGGVLLVVIMIIIIAIFVHGLSKNAPSSEKKYNTDKVYEVGELLKCPDFEITVDKVQYKKKGTRVDSFTVIDDPEWIGVTLTVKNTGTDTKTFYSSNVQLINSSGQVLEHSIFVYKIWGSELLDSPELVSGGTKTGFLEFDNTEKDNSNLVLKVGCGDGIFSDSVVYKVDISKK